MCNPKALKYNIISRHMLKVKDGIKIQEFKRTIRFIFNDNSSTSFKLLITTTTKAIIVNESMTIRIHYLLI